MSRPVLNISLDVRKLELRELIEEVMRGELCLYLPQFQRDFDWTDDKVRLLFDSIIRNLPVGSIILWGPPWDIREDQFAIPLIDLNSDSAERCSKSYYVLDGQQRLTSLLLLYNGWAIYRDGRRITRSVISLVPAQGKLIIGRRGGVDLSELVKAYIDGRFMDVASNYPSYAEFLRSVVRRIIYYSVPIYVIETRGGDGNIIAEMADAFVRINKAGMQIGTVELMLSFLSGMISGELSKKVREMHRELKDRGVDLHVIIRFILSNLGIEQTVLSNVNRFRARIKDIVFDKDMLDRSQKAMRLVMEFLRSELGLSTCRIIPSKVSLIPIAKYFYHQGITELGSLSSDERGRIVNWFILVNMKKHYSSSTNSKLERDLRVIMESKGAFPYTKLLANLGGKVKIGKHDVERGNTVNVLRRQGLHYLFLLYILLVKEKAEDLDGKLLATKEFSKLDKHHIFPKEVLEESGVLPDDPEERDVYVNGLGNITFITHELHEEIPKDPEEAEPIKYLPHYPPLLKHFIPADRELWRIENFEEFKRRRVELMYQALKKHFPEITE